MKTLQKESFLFLLPAESSAGKKQAAARRKAERKQKR